MNRDKKIIIDPLENLDTDEKMAILTDIINSDPVQNQLNIKSQKWEEMHLLPIFGGGRKHDKIGEYDCHRYRVTVVANNVLKKKIKKQPHQKEAPNTNLIYTSTKAYFDPIIAQEHLKNVRELTADENEKTKQIESDLWLSKDFPL